LTTNNLSQSPAVELSSLFLFPVDEERFRLMADVDFDPKSHNEKVELQVWL
jgi:hypothetical protein